MIFLTRGNLFLRFKPEKTAGLNTQAGLYVIL